MSNSGQKKRIGFRVASIHPKLKERKKEPATTRSNPNKNPFDRGVKDE